MNSRPQQHPFVVHQTTTSSRSDTSASYPSQNADSLGRSPVADDTPPSTFSYDSSHLKPGGRPEQPKRINSSTYDTLVRRFGFKTPPASVRGDRSESSQDASYQPSAQVPPDLPPKSDQRKATSAAPKSGDNRATRSIRKFFQSKSSRERQELEADRQRRRRSFVELDVEEPPDPATGQAAAEHEHPRNRGVPRSLRSISSHASSYSEHPSIWRRTFSTNQAGNERDRPADTSIPPSDQRDDSRSIASGPSSTSVEPPSSQRPPFSSSGSASPADSRQPSNNSSNPALRPTASTDSFRSTSSSGLSSGPDYFSQGNNSSSPRRVRKVTGEPPALPTVIASPPEPGPPPSVQSTLTDASDADRTPTINDPRMETSTSKWRMPFGRKTSGKRPAGQDDWDDYERGVAPPIASRPDFGAQQRGNNSKLASVLGVNPGLEPHSHRGGNRNHDVVSDLRDIGYLPSAPSSSSSPSSSRMRMPNVGPPSAGTGPRSPSPNGPHRSMASLPSASSMPLSHSSSSNDLSAASAVNDADCPVCLEPLSYRLAGEKPHVVPNCGHALHNACFTAVYGRPDSVLASQNGGSSPPGMCGVCRKAIVLGGEIEGGSSKGSKLAGMMGPDISMSRNVRPSDGGSDAVDPATDDPAASHQPNGKASESPARVAHTHSPAESPSPRHGMVHPAVRVRSEYSILHRKDPTGQQGKQNVVCVVTVEMPSRRPPPSPEEEEAKNRMQWRNLASFIGEDSVEQPDPPHEREDTGETAYEPSVDHHHNHQEAKDESGDEEGFSFGVTPAPGGEPPSNPHGPVLEDLRQRIIDWKGQTMERFGPLVLYDYLGVRQDAIVRQFWVYLFHDALLCVTEERKRERGLTRLMSTGSNGSSSQNTSGGPLAMPSGGGARPGLKLKGRIWIRHISRVQESSVGANFSLSIQLDDDSLDHFVLCFSERNTLDLWKVKLIELVDAHKLHNHPRPPPPQSTVSIASSNIKQGFQELPSSSAAQDPANHEYRPAPSSPMGRRSTSGSVMSGKSGSVPAASSAGNANIVENLRRASKMFNPGSLGMPTEQQWSASGGIDPSFAPPPMLPHTPLDLVLMVSVPVVVQQQSSGVSSSAALKLRLIRSTLEFVTSHMGPRDRVAIVAFTAGIDGEVRRTALLNIKRERSRAKLIDFIEGIGKPWEGDDDDPYRVDSNKLGGASERTDTVTALNVGLDVVLSRKSKNPCTGMILINDTSDGPVRGQMDLVMARAEAANVPIHCFGFGKSSNPSSLWLISNHTRGSYTFVREWYQLRECVAGCIGSLMSTALDTVKLFIAVPGDNHFKVRKVSGPTGAIVSNSGKEVDIELGELRFGEVHELFVELEVDFNGLVPFITRGANGANRQSMRRPHNAPAIEQGSATDDFMQRLGLSNLSLNDAEADDNLFEANAADGMQSLIEEVAVFEVDASYRDPAVGASLARLKNPTLLTIEVDASGNNPYLNLNGDGGNMPPPLPSDPIVTRRRIEILVSEMITRSLLLVSRKNYTQALRIVNETHKIVETVLRSLATDDVLAIGAPSTAGHGSNGAVDRRTSTMTNTSAGSSGGGPGSASTYHPHHRAGVPSQSSSLGGKARTITPRSAPARQRALLQRHAISSLLAILDDLELMSSGLESGQRPQFERDGRNAAAQQAMILRDQQAWTTRTATEALRFTSDNGAAFAAHAFAASRA
ncbi:hypothetical protein BDZ90DRAFT_131016 [Jaminaea rosea]|uniref:RING-type domain-containing protein n=1 Tax=Jaminaea rosea TaxID=1569628 RepID=A0A316UVH0_9BASI|nr:hypothetical protein BDZ90DRAFT_131016 [Jaminaea rosea]PWN28788.1 hypothetical protein BDZ90DRAFT_131016 [Jaminaea rosea]